MDFVRYAERSAGLVNADLADAEHLIHFLDERAWLHASISDRDAGALRRFVKELRPVFEASNAGDEHAVVDLLNSLLAKHPVTPYIAGHGSTGSGGSRWHMHVADRDSSGRWHFEGDPNALPPADTASNAGIYEYSRAPLLLSQILPPQK